MFHQPHRLKACLRGILWPITGQLAIVLFKRRKIFLQVRLDASDLQDLNGSKGWNIFLAMEWMKTNRVCNDYIVGRWEQL